MVNGAFNFVAYALNLAFEYGDAGLQLVNGERVQILLHQQNQRIIRATRKQFVHIHGHQGCALPPCCQYRSMAQTAFKIFTADQWAQFQRDGLFHGASVDLADGYIHMSTADQVEETLAKHFAGQAGLVVAEVDLSGFGEALKWEVSRGGALFPHLYGVLPMAAVIAHDER